MAFLMNDHIHTKYFTPREYQVELLNAAKERNIIICLDKQSDRTFIATKLIQELAIGNRKSTSENGKKTIVLLKDQYTCNTKTVHLQQMTDLKITQCTNIKDFDSIADDYQVLTTTTEIFYQLLTNEKIQPCKINLLMIDRCHDLDVEDEIQKIIQIIKSTNHTPRIIGFAVPLFNLAENPGQMSYEIQRIESLYQCQVETASDIMFILRYSPKPKEYLVEYEDSNKIDLIEILKNHATDTIEFLKDHRYDPLEIYSEEFLEDIKKIPDPTETPCKMIYDFLNILETLGPLCADKAALALLLLIEKLKIKTPYDRHYLLLNVVSTLLLKIRSICDTVMQGFSDIEKIYKFSTPKIFRLFDILRNFIPASKTNCEGNLISDNENVVKKNNSGVDNNSKFINNNRKNQRAFRNFKNNNTDGNSKNFRNFRSNNRGISDPDVLCGVIFVDNILTAKVLFYLLNELSRSEKEFQFLSPLYLSEKSNNDITVKDVEAEHKKQEEVLKKFRIHECNLLIATAILEEGIDIPKCNFIMRFDFPKSYQSYVQCKSRARVSDALHVLLTSKNNSKISLKRLAQFHYIEKILLSKCLNQQPSEMEQMEADLYSLSMPTYNPLKEDETSQVTFNSAITLVNRYCAKLPSDTFTRLVPEWNMSQMQVNDDIMYICFLRLPINSPLKYVITSYPMPNKALAKRIAALKLCIQLHKENELDDYLLPVGKENFKANPEDLEVTAFSDDDSNEFLEARPGTTKRRQYYYKKIAKSLTNCKPEPGKSCFLYHIQMELSCPLPEEQNTRGRKIYPPEDSTIGFGILTQKPIPKICPFPIYTRSGEVQVSLKLSKEKIVLNESLVKKIVTFLNYTFTNVLRLQKYLMMFDPNSSENSYFIVPVKNKSCNVNIDWDFLDCIYENRDFVPKTVLETERKNFIFNPSKYHDAVIMPWYRNQDQPQYFYVAEICYNLNPTSDFPGEDYKTFEEYYFKKYGIQIQNLKQPLLDVDHTSARLNFLTPRYVNRKGVALPTSSEETKKAKRENLEQKQILIGELCAIHPFPASLWRQAVCLPCILYRINALLLADQIRCKVAQAIGLGKETLDAHFEWPPLNFGWSLADVLNKTKEIDNDKKIKVEGNETDVHLNNEIKNKKNDSPKNDMLDDELEIGTWSNEMVSDLSNGITDSSISHSNWNKIRYGSPTYDSDFDGSESDNSYGDDYDNSDDDRYDNDDDDGGGLKITYTGDNMAEALDDERKIIENDNEREQFSEIEEKDSNIWKFKEPEKNHIDFEKHMVIHNESVKENENNLKVNGLFISFEKNILLREKNNFVKKEENGVEKYKDYVNTISDYFKEDVINSKLKRPNKKKMIQLNEAPEFQKIESFSFDYQPDLNGHPGPSPSLILQALTMSNANDGINLERLETIGDSFLKYAITTYLYSTYDNIHEGKLSHLRSKQVSNLNLYRLGRKKILGESMIATKFEPHDNWLPPCYYVPKELEQALIESGVPSNMWNQENMPSFNDFNEINDFVRETEQKLGMIKKELVNGDSENSENIRSFIPYNLITQHSIPDKSIADCVEALIGAYLIACGPKGALIFMTWLGINVIPKNQNKIISPLHNYIVEADIELNHMLDGYEKLENSIGYKFKDRGYLLQAFTHASYQPNRLTDCYQRLEFLGDAVLDYLITRHLYEDSRQHSPGALTDLRSALVNNTIFASLAVRCGFQKFFRHLSPGLNSVIDKFVKIQEENGHSISEEYCFIDDKECEEAEDVEVPKALGDVFESLAGAIYLDSDMSLDAVWSVYYHIMKSEIEQFSSHVPKSPIRELLELEPETAKFGKPEKLADGRRVRVTVDVFGKGSFKGVGRNYRIAKCTAAKCALKKLKKMHGHHRDRK